MPEDILPADKVLDAYEQEFKPATDAATMLIRSEVLPFTPHAFGYLRNSIGTRKATMYGSTVTGLVISTALYGAAVEDGSRPHWPPIEPLRLWAKRKLGDEGAAFPVARAIAKRGTKGHHMFEKGYKAAESAVLAIFEAARDRFIERLTSL